MNPVAVSSDVETAVARIFLIQLATPAATEGMRADFKANSDTIPGIVSNSQEKAYEVNREFERAGIRAQRASTVQKHILEQRRQFLYSARTGEKT